MIRVTLSPVERTSLSSFSLPYHLHPSRVGFIRLRFVLLFKLINFFFFDFDFFFFLHHSSFLPSFPPKQESSATTSKFVSTKWATFGFSFCSASISFLLLLNLDVTVTSLTWPPFLCPPCGWLLRYETWAWCAPGMHFTKNCSSITCWTKESCWM